MHWHSWEALCFPLEEGGLNFKALDVVSEAFAMKLWWKLCANDSLWAGFMHHKYIKHAHPMSNFSTVGSPV